jgi:hypothetical protein
MSDLGPRQSSTEHRELDRRALQAVAEKPHRSASARLPLDILHVGGDEAEHSADLGAERGDRDNANHGDQADEHTVFDQRSAFFVSPKIMEKLEHVRTSGSGSRSLVNITSNIAPDAVGPRPDGAPIAII